MSRHILLPHHRHPGQDNLLRQFATETGVSVYSSGRGRPAHHDPHEMVTTTFKIPPETLAALRAISCIETLRRGRRVTWAALVRDVIHRHLIVPNAGLMAAIPQPR